MRLARVGDPGAEVPVVAQDDRLLDVRPVASDITPDFLDDGGIGRVRERLHQLPELASSSATRIGPPISRPPKLICVGLNYRAHAKETGMEPPAEPVLFAKMSNTVVGPDDAVHIPRESVATDYEVELAVVLGATARYLDSPAQATEKVAGYTISNDVSERHFQLDRGGQWVKGKSCETFNPLGPWLVTPDDVGDPHDLTISSAVNGERRQHSNTADMIFSVQHLIWYVSQFMVLEAGDVINTGTPHGVAMGNDAYSYLAPGDTIEMRIDKLGSQRQTVVEAP